MSAHQRTDLINAQRLKSGILAQMVIQMEGGRDYEDLRKQLVEIDLLILRLETENDLLKSRGWDAP